MAEAKAKTFVTMKLNGSCPTHSRSDISTRDVETVIDEPEARGGTNLGLSPTETMIAALIGCTNVISNKIAHEKGIPIERMDISATVDFDRRGVILAEEVAVPFPKIVLDIVVSTTGTEDDLKAIAADLEKFCPVAKVIRASGTEIQENWRLA